MQDFWSWGGKYIGFRSGNYLYSRTGKPVGYFHNEVLYDFTGKYLAEIRDNNRLITVISHKSYKTNSIIQPINSCGRSCGNYIGNVMISGCEDFKFEE